MMNRRFVLGVSLLLFSATLCADPQNRVARSLQQATDEKAVAFVEAYYQRVAVGLVENELSELFSGPQQLRHTELVDRLAQITGQDREIEERRVLDLMRIESKCQTTTLDTTTTLGSADRSAVLKYRVKNHCAEWTPDIHRTVSLRYATDTSSWQIHRVSDREILQ